MSLVCHTAVRTALLQEVELGSTWSGSHMPPPGRQVQQQCSARVPAPQNVSYPSEPDTQVTRARTYSPASHFFSLVLTENLLHCFLPRQTDRKYSSAWAIHTTLPLHALARWSWVGVLV